MRSITVSAGLADGVKLGEAIEKLYAIATATLPVSARLSWDGESKEFLDSGSSLYLTFGMALLIVFLVLAAQFESFINPLIIMVTVPLALMGAVLGLWVYASSVNVFSQIGVILLVGLSAKNGVLIVEFANQLRDRGIEFRSGRDRGCGCPSAPDPDDQCGDDFWCLTAVAGKWCGCRIQATHRYRGRVRRHDFRGTDIVCRAGALRAVCKTDTLTATHVSDY